MFMCTLFSPEMDLNPMSPLICSCISEGEGPSVQQLEWLTLAQSVLQIMEDPSLL